MSSATPTSVPAAELLKAYASDFTPAGSLGAGRHQLGLLATLIALARAGQWHTFWCLLGDVVDEAVDIAVAWLTVVLLFVAAVAAGAVVGFAGGLIAATAYVLAVAGAVALWVRWWRQP